MALEISTTGGKWGRFKYRIDGKEQRISLGVCLDGELADARDKRDAVRRRVAAGIDSTAHHKAERVALEESTENTFEAIARVVQDVFDEVGPRPRRRDYPPP